MLRVNKKIEYGVIALLHLSGQPSKVASVREIAASCGIPETLLSKIMQSMKAVGIVASTHGNQGGYRLNRELAQISLLDINQCLVGPVQVAECLDAVHGDCPVKNCTIISPMQVLNQKIIHLFQDTSLETLSKRAG